MQKVKLASIGTSLMLLLLSFQNCSNRNFQSGNFSTPEKRKESLKSIETLDQQIGRLIADKSCKVNDDCEAFGYGAKACGGPEKYLVYSTYTTDPQELGPLVQQFNQLSNEKNLSSGAVSTCEYREMPPVACISNQCSENLPVSINKTAALPGEDSSVH
ncbi:MAG: hypothetical protein RJB66_2656 [Pseudomonadota bacterium]|jgi:hypothetical protein